MARVSGSGKETYTPTTCGWTEIQLSLLCTKHKLNAKRQTLTIIKAEISNKKLWPILKSGITKYLKFKTWP